MMLERPMVEGIIFDCDGVLIDSWEAHNLYFNRLRESVGLGPMNRDEQNYVFMHSVEEAINQIIPVQLQSVALNASNWLSMSEFCDHIRVMPGIHEFLDCLRCHGVKVAVNTNARSEVHEILKRLGLADYFELVMTAGDVREPKPASQGVKKILKYMQLPPARVAFIGDTLVDQMTAKPAGLPFWAYRNPQLEADLHVNDYPLLQYLMFPRTALPKAA